MRDLLKINLFSSPELHVFLNKTFLRMRMSIGYLKPLVNFFGREEKIKNVA